MSPYCADGSWCNGTYRYRLRMLAANGRPGWRDTVWVTFNDGGTPTPAPDPTPTPSPTTQPSGAWAGTWCSGSAQWGTVVLTQSGLNVSGTFANGVGQVAMTSSGDSMTGTWTRSASDGWPTNGGVTVTRTGTDGAGNALYSQDITYAGGYSPSTGVTWRAGPCAG